MPSICIIDDDAAGRDSLATLLRVHGYAVRDFSCPLRFLIDEAENGGDYACVIADLHMPSMSGLELLELIKIMKTRRSSVPFVVMTGRADNVQKERARRAGASVVLDKPIEEMALLNAIATSVQASLLGANLK